MILYSSPLSAKFAPLRLAAAIPPVLAYFPCSATREAVSRIGFLHESSTWLMQPCLESALQRQSRPLEAKRRRHTIPRATAVFNSCLALAIAQPHTASPNAGRFTLNQNPRLRSQWRSFMNLPRTADLPHRSEALELRYNRFILFGNSKS